MSTKRPTPPPADYKFDPNRPTSPPPPPRKPERRCEIFERVFCSAGMSGDDCLRKCESILPDLKKYAAEFAGNLLIKRGYFNGRIESSVYHLSTNDTKVSVVVTCYGLPQFNPENAT